MHHEKQQQAHDLYFNTDKTQQEIADILEVNRRTIYLWIKQGRWAQMKTAARQMPTLILQDVYCHINAINEKIFSRDEQDACPTHDEVDKLRMLVNMTTKIQKKHTGAYLEAFQELQYFIFNNDQELALKLREHIARFARGTVGDKLFMERRQRKLNVLDVVENLAKKEMQQQENSEQSTEDDATFCDKSDNSSIAPSQTPVQQNTQFSQCLNAENSDSDGIFCDKISPEKTGSPQAKDSPKPATVAAHNKTSSTVHDKKYPIGDFSPHAIFSPSQGHRDPADPRYFEQAMALPPHMRPSPFIDNDVVWITHPDHLENRLDTYGNEWGPIKMNQTIRYYPDLDPANTQAA